MKDDVGVALEGGPSDAFSRERASATPVHKGKPHPELAATRAVRGDPRGPLAVALRPLQRWFAATVMHPAGVAEGVLDQQLARGEVSVGVDDIERVVLPSSRLSGLERIEIYHQAYQARLVECLVDDYPAVQNALGEEPFADLCRRYMAAHPSESPSLNFFGRHFASFCRAWDDPLGIFAAELSTLEWSMVEVLHAAPAARLSLEALAALPLTAWEFARFVPSATLRVFDFEYPVNAYYQAFRQDEGPEVPVATWSATAVFRDGATIWHIDLSRPMHQLLSALLDGATLGGALDTLVEQGGMTEEQAPAVMVWFRDWVGHGFFGAIEVDR